MATRGTSRRQAHRSTASSFFRSRQRVPAVPEHYLRRPRLLRLLDDATSSPIISVVAPAGSGKTSLLADWCTASSMPTAWLSIDETDADGGQFWSAVASSLGGLVGGFADHGSPIRPPGSLPEAVAALVATLEDDHPDSAMLVLDDVHLIDHNQAVVASLALFLQSMPEWLHVVLLSRRTPKLPIDRLRVRGQLGEVRFAELRFSDEEAENLLVRLAPTMVEQEVCAVVARAGGWAAGLQLTALAVRSAQAQPGSLTHLDIGDLLFSDYVWHEILETERREVVEALLDTAVVRRTNPALAAALTGRPDAGELLLEAEARGLFVTRLGPSGWLEVHAVVRDELLAEATRRSPERVVSQHARAAQWFEESGELSSALDHWLLAGRPRDALRLLARHVAELYDTGREATITRTVSRIPLNVANADLPAMIEFAWCHLSVDKHRFVDAVQQASASLERFEDPGSTPIGRLRMLQAVTATITGDWAGGSQQATVAMSLLGESARSDPVGRFGWNLVARDIALSERWNEPSPELENLRLELNRDPERRLAYEGTRALGNALAGHPVDALRIAAGVWRTATENSMTILCAELGIAQAVAYRELGDRTRALTEHRCPWVREY